MCAYICKTPRPGTFLPLFPLTDGRRAGTNASHLPRAFLRNRNPTAAATPCLSPAPPGANLDFTPGGARGADAVARSGEYLGGCPPRTREDSARNCSRPHVPPPLHRCFQDGREDPVLPARTPTHVAPGPGGSALLPASLPIAPLFERRSLSEAISGSAIASGLGGLTVPQTGRKEGRKEAGMKRRREGGRNWLSGAGTGPRASSCSPPPPSRIRAPAQRLRRPEAPAPRSGREQTLPARAGSPPLPLRPPRLCPRRRRQHHSGDLQLRIHAKLTRVVHFLQPRSATNTHTQRHTRDRPERRRAPGAAPAGKLRATT